MMAGLFIFALVLLAIGAVCIVASGFEGAPTFIGGVCIFLALLCASAAFYYGPVYDIWQQEMAGKAELSRADQNRQIKVSEARARLESAKLDGEAEVARASGAAKANEILTSSLGGAENYLRWRYIQMLETNEGRGVSREVIYTPAGGMFPLTEAGRAVIAPEPKR